MKKYFILAIAILLVTGCGNSSNLLRENEESKENNKQEVEKVDDNLSKLEVKQVLFYKEIDKKYVLEDGEEVDTVPSDISPIVVINFIPDTIYSSFVEKMGEIDLEVRNKISQIKYDPSEYDDSRFMLYMVDGNYVYVTLTKFDAVNNYNEIYPTLNGKKGILYLDSGISFQEIKN